MANVDHARDILNSIGMPPAQCNAMSGMTLIALCGLKPNAPWSTAHRRRCGVTKGIMDYIQEHYGISYAPNTRETFRRQVLHQFVQAGIAIRNFYEPSLATNSPRTHYAVSEPLLEVVRCYGTREWQLALNRFLVGRETLTELYARERTRNLIPVVLSSGQQFKLSPGLHNKVQKAVIDEFAPRFAPGACLVYLGDTAYKNLFVDQAQLEDLHITITDHDKLPDVVLHDSVRNWLFLVEAVTSHGPMSPTRRVDLEEMFRGCPADPVYVSAFPNFAEFRRHMANIAWETEVWLSDNPDHMIHYDGERFLGPSRPAP